MSERTVNVPLLRKAVEWAEAEAAKPIELSEWEQGDWIATPEKRRKMIEENYTFDDVTMRLVAKAPACGTCYCIAGYVDQVILGNGDPKYGAAVETTAAKALGLGDEAANALFDPDNSVEDVRRIAESIAGERL